MVLALVLLLSVTLAPPFGEAEATAVSWTDATVVLDVRVEVDGIAEVVLVQPYGLDSQPLDALPMSLLDDGTWGTLAEMPRVSGVRLGFEVFAGTSREQSTIHSLVELGVDPSVFVGADVPPPQIVETSSPSWVWLGLAIGAGLVAVVLLVFWVRRKPEEVG